MASSAPLQLFPSSHAHPRQSSSRRPQVTVATKPHKLTGVALQVSARSPSSDPSASDTIKHSLLCDPPLPLSSETPTQRAFPETQAPTSTTSNRFTALDEHNQSSRPTTYSSSRSGTPPRRTASRPLKRPMQPRHISTEAQSEGDTLSPLPGKTRFGPASPRSMEYPPSISRSTSAATSRAPRSPGFSPPIRSIFPQYDPTKPLNAQKYYPTAQSPAATLPGEKISKPKLERADSDMTLVDGYEHIPAAQQSDYVSIWNASMGESPRVVRKVQLGLHQQDECLAVGSSAAKCLFSLDKTLPQSPSLQSQHLKHLTVEKHSPLSGASTPAAQLALPIPSESESTKDDKVGIIFPHQAALHAIQAISNSPAAAEIATFDPTARSPEAARLATDAVADAHRHFSCELSRAARRRDSVNVTAAAYTMVHPSLGALPITVTKPATPRTAQVKVSIHHPSATRTAVAAETMVLAFLDLSSDACVLDMPSLLALKAPYMVDTALAALLAVATLEKDHPTETETETAPATVTFAPPPKSPFAPPPGKKGAAHKEKRRWYKKSSKAINRAQKELVGHPADVGAPVQAAVALLGLSLKTAVFVIEAGVKMSATAIETVSRSDAKP